MRSSVLFVHDSAPGRALPSPWTRPIRSGGLGGNSHPPRHLTETRDIRQHVQTMPCKMAGLRGQWPWREGERERERDSHFPAPGGLGLRDGPLLRKADQPQLPTGGLQGAVACGRQRGTWDVDVGNVWFPVVFLGGMSWWILWCQDAWEEGFPIPRHSTFAIYAYIDPQNHPNV